MKQLALIAMVACLLLPSGLMAQFERAAVLGTIQDSTGAVAPGVAVTLTNVQTGIAQAAVTGTTGNFQFLNVAIGQYQVDAEHTGFKKAVSDTFSVVVGARQRVDLVLEVGETTETVEVGWRGAAAGNRHQRTGHGGQFQASCRPNTPQRPFLRGSYAAYAGHLSVVARR